MGLFGFKKRTYYDGLGVATDEIGSNYFQLVKLCLGALGTNDSPVSSTNPLPVTLAATSTPLTPTETVVPVAASSTLVLAASSTRAGGYIVNVSDTTIYLSLNTPADTTGIPLHPNGGVYQLTINFGRNPITNAIYGISASGSKNVRVIVA